MPTAQQVRALLWPGRDFRRVGRQLGIPPGLAYLIATGLPADGGDAPTPEERRARGTLPTSQQLSNPPAENVAAPDVVRRWLAARVAADAQMRGA